MPQIGHAAVEQVAVEDGDGVGFQNVRDRRPPRAGADDAFDEDQPGRAHRHRLDHGLAPRSEPLAQKADHARPGVSAGFAVRLQDLDRSLSQYDGTDQGEGAPGTARRPAV